MNGDPCSSEISCLGFWTFDDSSTELFCVCFFCGMLLSVSTMPNPGLLFTTSKMNQEINVKKQVVGISCSRKNFVPTIILVIKVLHIFLKEAHLQCMCICVWMMATIFRSW